MRATAIIVALGGAGLVALGGVVLAKTILFASGCVDECHAGFFGGVAGLLLLGGGLVTLALAMTLSAHRQARQITKRNRRPAELRAPR